MVVGNDGAGTIEQKLPEGKGSNVGELVKKDIDERIKVGTQRYGEPLRSFNGRNALVDAYQEALDLVNYLRQCLDEQLPLEKDCQLLLKATQIVNDNTIFHKYLLTGTRSDFPTTEFNDIQAHIHGIIRAIHDGDNVMLENRTAKIIAILIFINRAYGR